MTDVRAHGELRVAVVGAGPAGIHAAAGLLAAERAVSVDLIECLPTPYGLIRYGVAPDHPRIKGIVAALDRTLVDPRVRLFGNVRYGIDVTLDDLCQRYHAVVVATGADRDRDLAIPGVTADGVHGAAEFVAWYNGHPDAPRSWPLQDRSVAVLGMGNVALDVARVLARPAVDFEATDVPDTVLAGLRASRVRDVHVFGRRGPAQASFSPLELRELAETTSVRVVVDPADLVYDEASRRARESSRQVDAVCAAFEQWSRPGEQDGRRTVFLHFMAAPVAIEAVAGRVVGLRTERTVLDGHGRAVGTGRFTTWPLGAVYRAIGYRSTPPAGLPFDAASGTVPHDAGRVLDGSGAAVPGVYVTGWVKRGPVGLIGHTKNDALETVRSLVADTDAAASSTAPLDGTLEQLLHSRQIAFTTLDGWRRIDDYERAAGAARDSARAKVVDRAELLAIGAASAIEPESLLPLA